MTTSSTTTGGGMTGTRPGGTRAGFSVGGGSSTTDGMNRSTRGTTTVGTRPLLTHLRLNKNLDAINCTDIHSATTVGGVVCSTITGHLLPSSLHLL